MRSTFYGFDIAAKGLFTAQRQMDVTAHNIANAHTVGYTRQRIIQSAIEPGNGSKWLHVATQMTGGGVRILSVDQIRDAFLDRQFRNKNTEASYWDTRYSTMYYIEDIFNNLASSYSISALLGSFFGSISELSKDPTGGAVRTNVVETALSMVTMLHSYYDQLSALMTQQDEMLVAQTLRINDIGKQVAELNESILKYELSGYVANDLRDKRNLLLDELSGFLNISYQEVLCGVKNINGQELSMLEIRIGGDLFVDGIDCHTLVAAPDNTIANDIWVAEMLKKYGDPSVVPPEEMLHTVRFATGPNAGSDVKITNGALRAYLDLRDGNTVDVQGIPYFKAQLDKLAAALVGEFNKIHRQGWSMPYTDNSGVKHDSITNVDFFDPSGLTIDSIALSAAIKESVNYLAPSSVQVVVDPATGDFETGNNEIALTLYKLKDAIDIAVIGGFERYYNTFLAGLASEVGHARQAAEQDMMLASSLGDQRMSVSAVSLDEEMTNLIRFQQAYNAAARVITAIDETLDVLINRTGRVGL
ncbi:MAG: flagellar hook-associated protein FlgK [Oscillospiraceae bacterium]|nr:flagellar hook-associated protein FlgK [Oscillospiraceae bacterium]